MPSQLAIEQYRHSENSTLRTRFESLSVQQSAIGPQPKQSNSTPKTSDLVNGTVICENGTNCTDGLLKPYNPADDIPVDERSMFEKYFGYFKRYSEISTAFLWNMNAASVGKVSGNLTVCQGNLTVLYNNSMTIYGEYRDFYFAEAGYSTYEILKSVDPIIFSCYYSLFEYYIALQIYGETGKDINKLTYNFAHNLGNIYDMTEEGIVRTGRITEVYTEVAYWARMGTIIGTNFQSVFEDPINYYPYNYEYPDNGQER